MSDLLPANSWQKIRISGLVSLVLYFLTTGLLSLYLSPFLYSFAFCYPRGDDYDGITRAMFLFDLPGALYELVREWLFWSGRYTYHFLAVFLGKAADSRIAYGLVCFSVLLSYVYGFFKLAQLTDKSAKKPLLFSLLCTCALLCCHTNLIDFYLLTDALTIVLQLSFYLLATAQLLIFLKERLRKGEKHNLRLFVIFSILAIGVYEHAALAIFWTYSVALTFIYFSPADPFAEGKKPYKSLLNCAPWLMGAWLFSFFAPGNAQRRVSRHVELNQQLDQLINVPVELGQFLQEFFLSSWPVTILCISVIYRLWIRRPQFSSKKGILLVMLSMLAFILFALSLLSLHALSDVPFTAQGKLQASLEVYAAFTLCFIFCFVPWSSHISRYVRGLILIICSGTLLYLLTGSGNYQKTVRNAANGEMLILADFMTERREILEQAKSTSSYVPDDFGLLGELRNPNARKRDTGSAIKTTVIPGFQRPVFPVYTLPDLKTDPSDWPNIWAAWVYGLPALSERPPYSLSAIHNIEEGNGNPLDINEALFEAGLSRAWLYIDNSSFGAKSVWLVLEASKPLELNLLLPIRPNIGRLLPVSIQEKVWLTLASVDTMRNTVLNGLCTLHLQIALMPRKKLAMWLGPCTSPPWWANYFFASKDALIYYKMTVSK